jgi:hypothetical protein
MAPVATPIEVEVTYRWRHAVTDPCAVFIVDIIRAGLKKEISFQLDIARLETSIRAQVQAILIRHREEIDDPLERRLAVSWLLELSLEQSSPMSLAERQVAVMEVFTIPEQRSSEAPRDERQLQTQSKPEQATTETSSTLGVSPLLAFVSQRGRNRLLKRHGIDIGKLEQDSIQLYLGLEQFEKILPDSDVLVKAKAYTAMLIVHHQRVKQAAQLLGDRLGKTLKIMAALAIEKLLKQTL